MCSTSPPVLLGAFVALASRLKKIKFIYHCMDIHPEIGKLSGEFNNSLIYKFLFKLDVWTINSSDKTIVLEQDGCKRPFCTECITSILSEFLKDSRVWMVLVCLS